MSAKTLTIQEALAEGYQYGGYEGHDYQTLLPIDELQPQDFTSCQGKIMIFSKESTSPTCEEDIKDFLADHLQERWWDESHDDSNDVRDIIRGLDLSDLAEKINKALESKRYHLLTDIQLLP